MDDKGIMDDKTEALPELVPEKKEKAFRDWSHTFESWGEAPSKYRGATLEAWDPKFGAVYRLPKDSVPDYGGNAKLGMDDLSEDQTEAVDAVLSWHRGVLGTYFGGNALALGGYAGTGKTTVVSLLAKEIGAHRVAFVAFTGKAAAVLRRKLTAAGVHPGFCGTIHSCIYMPEVDEKTGRVVGWELREWGHLYDGTDLIICDEASMVDTKLWEDLRSYMVPVLAVGDPGQLPPVGHDCESPVANPDILLGQIHRQAEGNPVIDFATRVRTDAAWETFSSSDPRFNRIGKSTQKGRDFVHTFYNPGDSHWLDKALLCRYNKTRVGLNAAVRGAVGKAGAPKQGDIVTILKNIKIEGAKLYNGMRGEVVEDSIDIGTEHRVVVTNFYDDGVMLVSRASRFQFGSDATFRSYDAAVEAGHESVRRWSDLGVLMDYAYALTVHKSQGSQYSEVGLFLEASRYDSREDHLRWVYTGASRAAERLTVVS